jgi:hypothetical protein
MYRTAEGFLSFKYVTTSRPADSHRTEWACTWQRSCNHISAACRLGKISVNNLVNAYKASHESGTQWGKIVSWVNSYEYLRLLGSLDHYEMLLATSKVGTLMFTQFSTGETCEEEHTCRLLGHWILEYNDAVYILDFAAMDQVHAYAKFCGKLTITVLIIGCLGNCNPLL